jgi:hypothetical protein
VASVHLKRIVQTMCAGAAFLAFGLSTDAVGFESRAQTGPPASFESVNVCESVAGETLAKSVSGRLLDARAVNVKNFQSARCLYGVEIGGTRRTFVLWYNPADDFDGLRKVAEPPVQPVAGIGDQAYTTFDKDSKRYTLTAVKRGKVTIQVTGEQVDLIQAIARLALSKF